MTECKIDFVTRFVADVARLAGGGAFSDGLAIAEYAEMIAPQYFGDGECRRSGPEACAVLAMDAVRERRRVTEKKETRSPRPMAEALDRIDTFGRLHPNRKARRSAGRARKRKNASR